MEQLLELARRCQQLVIAGALRDDAVTLGWVFDRIPA
jgi:hypothetical protein